MSNQNHNREAYLDRVDRELSGLDFAERNTILNELADHYDDLQSRMGEDNLSPAAAHRQIWSSMGDPAEIGTALRKEHLGQSSDLWHAVSIGLPFLLLGALLAQPAIHGEFWRLWAQHVDPLMPAVMMGAMLMIAVGLFIRYRWNWLSTVIGFGAFLTVLPLTRLLDITSSWPLSAAWAMLCLAVVVPAAVLFTLRAGVQHTMVALLAGTGAYGIFALSLWISDWASIALVVVPFLAIVLFRVVQRRYWLFAGAGAMLGVWGLIFIIPMQYYGATFGPIPAFTQPPEFFPVRSAGEWVALPLVPTTLFLVTGIWLLLKVQDLNSVRTFRMSSLNSRRQRV